MFLWEPRTGIPTSRMLQRRMLPGRRSLRKWAVHLWNHRFLLPSGGAMRIRDLLPVRAAVLHGYLREDLLPGRDRMRRPVRRGDMRHGLLPTDAGMRHRMLSRGNELQPRNVWLGGANIPRVGY